MRFHSMPFLFVLLQYFPKFNIEDAKKVTITLPPQMKLLTLYITYVVYYISDMGIWFSLRSGFLPNFPAGLTEAKEGQATCQGQAGS